MQESRMRAVAVEDPPASRPRVIAALTVLCGAGIATALAQEGLVLGEDASGILAERIDQRPVIDGNLDEEIWRQAPTVRDLKQVNPVEFAEPSEATEVYVLYDADALYIGARLYDSRPEQIVARILRQGQGIGSDDRFFVHLDSFGNRRSGYLFGVNPNGVRYDGVFENINSQSFDWDGIWRAAARIDAEGWTVEMEIPFKTLSFDPANTTWRMNFARNIQRNNESMAWSSRNRSTDLSTMREVRGISQIDQGMGLDVVPSVSIKDHKEFVGGTTQSDFQPSLDVFYKITPSLNGSLTVNTDFSATEVDDRQVNLTRFSLFFPERRDFFLQDADIFQFGRIDQDGRPFFSRTIGISETGLEVPIDVGAKVSGRIGRFDIGTLAVRQEEFGPVDATTVFVGRAAANVLAESSVGVIVTDGDPQSNLDNSVLGLDFRFLSSQLLGGRGLEGEAWVQETDTDGIVGEGGAFGVGLRFPSAVGWRGGFGLQRFEANFNPAMGFVRRRDVDQYDFFVNHQWRPLGGRIRTIRSGANLFRVDFLDTGDVQSESIGLNLLDVELNSQDEFGLNVSRDTEGLLLPFAIAPGVVIPAGEYTFDRAGLNIRTGNQRALGTGLFMSEGEFYDGDMFSIGGFIGWRPSRNFRTNLNYQYDDIVLPGGSFITRVLRLQLEAIFSSKLSWTNRIQYDNQSQVVGVNSRLHWIPQAGREAFLVLNHNSMEDADGSLRSISSDVALKFSYTFRF